MASAKKKDKPAGAGGEYEIRFRGALLSHHASEADATAHADEHHTDPDNEGYRGEFQIAPRKPIELHIRGQLVDTFDSMDEAWKAADALADALMPEASGREVAQVFEIVDRSKGEQTKADRVGLPSSPDTEPSGPPDWALALPPF